MSKKTKKSELDLKKLACDDAFDVKAASQGVFIEGFANKSTVDRGDEIIQGDGKTPVWELDNFKRNPIILFNHGMDTLGGTPVGKAMEVREGPDGLYLKVKMSNSQAPGIRMVRELVEERILKAFSVGFNPKQSDMVEQDGKSIRKISKAELFEVSIVGVPMNQDSLFELSEKSLTTKSFHQLKGEILVAKKATAAARVEMMLAQTASRKDVIALVAKAGKIELSELLDMLAGDKELPEAVEAAFPAAIKQADLKQTLEEALSALGEGADETAVLAELRSKLEGDKTDEEETEETQDDDKTEAGKEEEEADDGGGKDPPKPDAEDGGGKTEEEDQSGDDDAKRKADFQDCVNARVPKLIEDGMEQDEAVAAAIAQCQESGKCQLTPESKSQVYAEVFAALDTKATPVMGLSSIAFKTTEEEQANQAPTTPVKTEDNAENFGSPFLEAAKQTNVLLGALISEIQGLRKEVTGLSKETSVASEDDPSKVQAESSDGKAKPIEDDAEKRLASLNQRLKTLGH